MTDTAKIKLRYFDARGRGQFLRAYLRARDIEFEDERVPIDQGFASWSALREDRSLTGPLQRLPVLEHGDELIPETLVIADFLHRQFGDAESMSAVENRRHAVLVSTGYVDLMITMGMLLWADMLYKGVDMASAVPAILDRYRRTLGALERTMNEWGWVDGMRDRRVTVADCMLWEELDKARTTFGPHLRLGEMPALERFHAECPARATFEALLAERPAQITARPGEAEAIERVQALLAEAAAA
jgi:glutathione S-transferase